MFLVERVDKQIENGAFRWSPLFKAHFTPLICSIACHKLGLPAEEITVNGNIHISLKLINTQDNACRPRRLILVLHTLLQDRHLNLHIQ